MEADQLVDRGAGGGLAALVEPRARDHRREIGAPDPRHEHRVAGGRHRAGRGAEDVGHASGRIALGADGADPAGVGVDQARRDRGPRDEPEFRRCGVGETGPERGARLDDLATDPGEVIVGQVAKPDRMEVVGVPAPFVREVSPLAGDRAGRSGEAARRPPSQEVGQVEELPGGVVDHAAVFLEPEQLRRLHLRRDGAADVGEHGVAAGVDAGGLIGRAVVHPDDNVAGRILARPHRQASGHPARGRRASRWRRSQRPERPSARRPPAPSRRERQCRRRPRSRRSTARRSSPLRGIA